MGTTTTLGHQGAICPPQRPGRAIHPGFGRQPLACACCFPLAWGPYWHGHTAPAPAPALSSLGYRPGYPEPQRWASPLLGAVSSQVQQACQDWPGRKEISFCLMIQPPRCLTVLAGTGNKTICHVIAEQTVCKELPWGRRNVPGLLVLLIRLKTQSMILHPRTGSGVEI